MTPLDPITLERKARDDLGWDQLVAHLASRCHTDRGARAARAIEPSGDVAWIRGRIAEVSEARALADSGEPLLWGSITDVETDLARADKGGHLDGGALRAIAATLRGGSRLRSHLAARVTRAPRLGGRAALLSPLDDVAAPIDDSFDDAGQLLDSASPSLGGLRKRAAALHEELGRRARSLLDHPSITPHLQDHFYTQRDERYVIPVRTDARTRIKGIVHGTSGSGQTVFVEPEEIVDLNNRLKLAELEVVEEERRILGELTLLVKDAIPAIRVNLEILEVLDVIDGAARLAADLVAREPIVDDSGVAKVDLRHARHPLMVLSGRTCVPNDVLLARGGTMVVSGPNAGGKTVALKTTGLLSLMARAGLHLPAQEGSSLPLFATVMTDVGDEQSLERNLSTFSAHVLRLNAFLAAAGPGTLVLLDEVAVGTDPEQGAALAQAVLEALAARGATVVVTTHYDRLKALAARDPRFVNASVGFDLATLSPTYQLHLGVPGSSGAIVVAKRLGLPEAIGLRASELLGRRDGVGMEMETLLAKVEVERRRLQAAAAAVEQERAGAEAERARAEKLADEAATRLREARRGGHDEAIDALKRARVEFDAVRAALRKMQGPGAGGDRKELTELGQRLDRLAGEVAEHAPARPALEGERPSVGDLAVGMAVMVARLGGRGVITAIQPSGKVAVQVGALKLTVAPEELRLPLPGKSPPPAFKPHRSDEERLREAATYARTPMRTGGNTLDLRGERAHVACALAEKFLDDALRDGQDAIFLLHGHGTGALREALREHLGATPGVELRPGTKDEGGDGVTVVLLR